MRKVAAIIDDDANLRESLKGHLEKWGFDVVEHAGGSRAAVFLARHRPSVCFLAMLMRDRQGVDVLMDLENTDYVQKMVVTSWSKLCLTVVRGLKVDDVLLTPITEDATTQVLLGLGFEPPEPSDSDDRFDCPAPGC